MGKINLRNLLAGCFLATIVAPTTVGILASVDGSYKYQQAIYNIAKTNYNVATSAGNDAKSINDQITADFIKHQLTDEVKDSFKEKLFHFNKVTIGNKDLDIKDLRKVKTFDALINYNYGSIIGVSTNLTITVTEPNPLEAKIVNEINNAIYQLNNIPIKTTVSQVKTLINGDFIKAQLSTAAKRNFDGTLFKLTKITETGTELEDSRLEQAQTLYTKLDYDYGSIKDQKTDLHIEVVGIDDEQIAFAISETTYHQEVKVNSSATALETLIDADFIKAQLEAELQKVFNWVLLNFAANKITVDGNKLSDEDLKVATTITAKINYNYGQYENYETTLIITIK